MQASVPHRTDSKKLPVNKLKEHTRDLSKKFLRYIILIFYREALNYDESYKSNCAGMEGEG